MKRSPEEPAGKAPGFYLYVGDLERELQALTAPAQALWTRMLLKMHEAPRRGFLEHSSGLPFTIAELARLVGVTVLGASKILEEMRRVGTFSEVDGVILNRRMVRDTKLSEIRRQAGLARAPLVSVSKVLEQNRYFAEQHSIQRDEQNRNNAEQMSARVLARPTSTSTSTSKTVSRSTQRAWIDRKSVV